jgi:peptide/nickel transport system ATP-binding protein
MPLLEVEALRTYFALEGGRVARAVDGVSFAIEEGGSLGLVGESACGKSVTALSLLRLVQPPGYHAGGAVRFEGQDLARAPEEALRRVRGNRIAMIFQEPINALNPVFSIGNQLAEPLRLHQGLTARAARRRGAELLEQLGIAAPETVLDSFPHQLSGGMRQRAMIAMAMACRPRLLIADEPTTALDVTVQAQILALLRGLRRETGMALLLITHDLGIVNQLCERVAVMYSGRIAESGAAETLLRAPAHPYTVKLLASMPRHVSRERHLAAIGGTVKPATEYAEGCRFAERCDHAAPRCAAEQPALHRLPGGSAAACHLADPDDPLPRRKAPRPSARRHVRAAAPGPVLLETREITTHFPIREGFFRRVTGHVRAVDGVSLSVRAGTTLGLVGESGCGKTTFGHSLLRLEPQARGEVWFQGVNLAALSGDGLRRARRDVQVIFQDPFSSLNPRLPVQDLVGEGLRVHEPGLTGEQRRERVRAVLEEVGLPADAAGRYAHEFSGGQRQRIAIARALILRPRFIVLDEATSALDVSVQAQILNLLRDLQARHGLTYLFITHDLGVVRYLAHEVAVMYLGRIVERGPAEAVLGAPAHPYTRSLLAAVPSLERRWKAPHLLAGETPSPISPPPGCHFHPRCPLLAASGDPALRARCVSEYPEPRPLAPAAHGEGHREGHEEGHGEGHGEETGWWARCWALPPAEASAPPRRAVRRAAPARPRAAARRKSHPARPRRRAPPARSRSRR